MTVVTEAAAYDDDDDAGQDTRHKVTSFFSRHLCMTSFFLSLSCKYSWYQDSWSRISCSERDGSNPPARSLMKLIFPFNNKHQQIIHLIKSSSAAAAGFWLRTLVIIQYHYIRGPQTFWAGGPAGGAPDKLAVGWTGKTSQLHTNFFPNFAKNVPMLLDQWPNKSSVREPVSVNECESHWMSTVGVRLNPARRQNNRSSFGTFGRSTRAGFNFKTDELPQAGSTEPVGRIWPAGQTLLTAVLHAHTQFINLLNWQHFYLGQHIFVVFAGVCVYLCVRSLTWVGGQISPKRPETETQFQLSTCRKWPMGNRIVTCVMKILSVSLVAVSAEAKTVDRSNEQFCYAFRTNIEALSRIIITANQR